MPLPPATRQALKSIARTVGLLPPPPDYDVQLYEALCRLRDWSETDVVFDVGANDGRTILRWQRHLPSPRILAFEPVADTFQDLARRTAHLPNVERHQLAFGTQPGEVTMYLNDLAALNSLYPEWGSGGRTETVRMDTIDAFAASRGIDRIRLLKVDAEGHDLEVLKGAEAMIAAGRVEMIQVEAGFDAPGKPQPSLASIREWLAPHGFYLYGIYNQCRGHLGPKDGNGGLPEVLVYCDALFVNTRSLRLIA